MHMSFSSGSTSKRHSTSLEDITTRVLDVATEDEKEDERPPQGKENYLEDVADLLQVPSSLFTHIKQSELGLPDPAVLSYDDYLQAEELLKAGEANNWDYIFAKTKIGVSPDEQHLYCRLVAIAVFYYYYLDGPQASTRGKWTKGIINDCAVKGARIREVLALFKGNDEDDFDNNKGWIGATNRDVKPHVFRGETLKPPRIKEGNKSMPKTMHNHLPEEMHNWVTYGVNAEGKVTWMRTHFNYNLQLPYPNELLCQEGYKGLKSGCQRCKLTIIRSPKTLSERLKQVSEGLPEGLHIWRGNTIYKTGSGNQTPRKSTRTPKERKVGAPKSA
jgi:hypothetical protein